MRHIAAVTIVTAVLLFTQTSASVQGGETKIPQMVDMTPAIEEPSELHALSAVLMDGDSGRILYQKDGEVPMKRMERHLLQMPAQQKYLPVLWHWRVRREMIMYRFPRMQLPSRKSGWDFRKENSTIWRIFYIL